PLYNFYSIKALAWSRLKEPIQPPHTVRPAAGIQRFSKSSSRGERSPMPATNGEKPCCIERRSSAALLACACSWQKERTSHYGTRVDEQPCTLPPGPAVAQATRAVMRGSSRSFGFFDSKGPSLTYGIEAASDLPSIARA